MTTNKEDDRMPCMDCGGDNEPLPSKPKLKSEKPKERKEAETPLWPTHLG